MAQRSRTQAQIEADKRRTGRPPKPRSEKQYKRITVYLTPGEYQRFQELARKEGVSLAEIVMRPWRKRTNDHGRRQKQTH